MYMAREYGFSLDEKHKENHKAYIVSWSKALKENPDELFRAARLADKALDYINTKMLGKNLEQEQKKEQLKEKAPEKNREAEKGMEQFGEPLKEQDAAKEKAAERAENTAKEQDAQEKEAKPKTRARKAKGRERGMAM